MAADALCECSLKTDHPDGAESCSAAYTDGDRELRCTRPAGHGGPHSACNVVQHPITTWSDEEDTD